MKRLDFATTVVESQSYIGEQALEYILACFLKNKTADSGDRQHILERQYSLRVRCGVLRLV